MVPRILSTGLFVPEKILTNDQLAKQVDTSDEWIYSHTGIRERRIAEDGQATSDLAIAAGRQALDRAGLDPSRLDLILVATSTPDFLGFPSTASLVQNAWARRTPEPWICPRRALGLCMPWKPPGRSWLRVRPASFWSLEPRCSAGLSIGPTARPVFCSATGRPRFLSDLRLRRVPRGGLPPPFFGPTAREGRHCCGLREESRKPFADRPSELLVSMDGRRVYAFAITVVKDIILQILLENGLRLDDVDWVCRTKANGRIVTSAAHRLGFPLERFYVNMEHYANTSGASIPLALAEMDQKGLLKRGQLVVTVGFGAGLTWGANLFRW